MYMHNNHCHWAKGQWHLNILLLLLHREGKRRHIWSRHYATSREFAGSIPDEVGEISSLTIICVHNGSKVVSVNDINEYQEYSLQGKGDRCVGLTKLPLSCACCLDI